MSGLMIEELEARTRRPSAQIVQDEEGARCECTDDAICAEHHDQEVAAAREEGYIEGHYDAGGE